jgi:hypothetical protein
METSFALGQWSAMKDANTRLDNGYRRSGGNVIIFFSIVRRCFVHFPVIIIIHPLIELKQSKVLRRC